MVVEVEEEILEHVKGNQEISTRQLRKELRLCKYVVHEVL